MCLDEVYYNIVDSLNGATVEVLPRKKEWKNSGPHYTDDMVKYAGRRFVVKNRHDEWIGGFDYWWSPEWLKIIKSKHKGVFQRLLSKRQKVPKSVVAYKVCALVDGQYRSNVRGMPLKIGKTYNDKSNDIIGSPRYRTGFHCWQSLGVAREHSEDESVLKVRLWNIVATGVQNNHRVYVGRKMKVLGVVE